MLERIKTLKQLKKLVLKKKAVIVPNTGAWRKPRPAAFMIHLSGEILLRLFERGMYEYKKAEK